jgi:hypothetical protein
MSGIPGGGGYQGLENMAGIVHITSSGDSMSGIGGFCRHCSNPIGTCSCNYVPPWSTPEKPFFPGTATMHASQHKLAVTNDWLCGWNACLDEIDRRGGFAAQRDSNS